jgi:hypothetical protein
VASGCALFITAQCTFPQYEVDPPLVVGGAGTGAIAGMSGGSVATSGGQGGDQASAGAAELGGGGVTAEAGAPGCPGEQWPIDHCDGGCLTRYPDHCYDEEQADDELAPDCGGSCQPCVVERCVEGSDCLSGVCVDGPDGRVCESPLLLLHEAHEKNNSVGSTAWSMTLQNVADVGGKVFTISDLKIRYYLDRNGVVEPIMLRATQSNLRLGSGENRELVGTRWSVIRSEALDDLAYNAYVEVSFSDSGKLFPGDQIELYEQMLTGDPGLSNFDQRANYSFTDQPKGPWEHITVMYREQLVWGLEPRPANPRACFAKGVNLNGPAVTIDGNPWLAASQAGVSSNGTGISQGAEVFPPVSGDSAAMLATAYRLPAAHELSVTVENGEYLLYLYAVSPTTDASSSTLTVDGVSFDNSSKFRSQASDGGLTWARLGPYRTLVTTGQITVAVTSGSVDFAGFELWYPE